jgi:hypothetical protein
MDERNLQVRYRELQKVQVRHYGGENSASEALWIEHLCK